MGQPGAGGGQEAAQHQAPAGRIFLSLDIKRKHYKSRGEECLYSSAVMLPFLQRNVDISLQ